MVMTGNSKSAIRKISAEIGILTFLPGCLFQTLAEKEYIAHKLDKEEQGVTAQRRGGQCLAHGRSIDFLLCVLLIIYAVNLFVNQL